MKRIILIIIMGIFMMGLVTSAILTTHSYTDDDLKVEFKTLGLIDLGSATLKSHKTVDEIKQFGYGQEEVVMFYDIDFLDLQKDGLGEVYFTNENTNKEIEKDFKFVYWTNVSYDKPIYKQVCEFTENKTSICTGEITGYETAYREDWADYNSHDIPQGEIRIGLKTIVEKGDYVDAVWTIIDEKISLHASWSAGLDTNLEGWWTFNETTGNANDISGNGDNLIEQGTVPSQVGILDNARGVFSSSNYLKDTTVMTFDDANDFSTSFWMNWTGGTTLGRWVNFGNGLASGFYCAFLRDGGNSGIRVICKGATSYELDINNIAIAEDEWSHVAFRYYGTNKTGEIFINGTLKGTDAVTTAGATSTQVAVGAREDGVQSWGDGYIDEIGLWSRPLTLAEITDLYNGGAGLNPLSVDTTPNPNATLIAPTNYTNYTISNTVNFEYNCTDEIKVDNCTLYINGTVENLNTSGVNGTYYHTISSADGWYNWSVIAVNNNSNSNASETWWYNVSYDTGINATALFPEDSGEYTENFLNITAVATDNYGVVNVTLYIDTVINETDVSGVNGTYQWNKTFSDGSHTWHIEVYDNDSNQVDSSTNTFEIDTISPNITIINPIEGEIYLMENYTDEPNINITLNWTTVDVNLDDCWYFNETGNTTLTCGDNATIELPYGTHTFKVYANDSVGHLTEEGVTARWIYIIFENNITFNNQTTELAQETFELNIDYNSSIWSSISGILNYAGTNYTTTSITGTGDTRNLNRVLSIPSVDADVNNTFYWVIRLTNATGEFFFNSGSNNQTVLNISIDDCSAGSDTLFNLTLWDEITQLAVNGTIEVDVSITGINGDGTEIAFSTAFADVINATVCLNNNLTSNDLSLDTKIKYYATGYQTEYYNIRGYPLNISSLTQHISLFDLNTTFATVFDILYKGADFTPVQDALIDITKEYVAEGLFKTVEIPITDIDGKTTASMEKDDAVYTFNVYKGGALLSTFQNVIPVCDNELTEECRINLNAVSTTTQIEDFTTLDDLNYLVDWDEPTKLITLTFSTATGVASDMNLSVLLADADSQTLICSEGVTSASGTLTCTVPDTYVNATVLVYIYQDNLFIGSYRISLAQDPTDFFGYTGYFLAFIMMIMIPFMFITSLIGVVIGIVIGMIMVSLLLLSTGANIYSVTGGIMWFMVASVILIWKLNQTERR